jgi:signal transduction histidine kinase
MDSSYTEDDTRHIEELRQRNEALIASLTEKDAELERRERALEVERALEKVRARANAMESSDELNEVVAEVFAQLEALGFDPRICNIILYDRATRESTYWLSTHKGSVLPRSYHVPFIDHPYHHEYDEALRTGAEYSSIELSGESKRNYDKIFFTETEFHELPEDIKNGMMSLESVVVSSAFMGSGSIEVVADEPLSPDRAEILKRFARVFEQTYNRFLDVKKAEAQTREARIEAALDKIRARTMAMNHSEDIADAAGLLYSELIKLGIMMVSCGYVLIDRNTRVGSYYMASPEGSFELEAYDLGHSETEVMKRIYTSWEEQEPYCVIELKGQENMDHHTYVALNAKNFPWTVKKFLASIPEDAVLNTINFSHGYLSVQGIEPYTTSQLALLVRFSKVFDLTYRRFLDIKNAEAQARESQVQACLERIRARALAMHSSKELIDVANVLWDQMLSLNQPELESSAIHLYEDNDETFDAWYAVRTQKNKSGHLVKGRAQFGVGTALAKEWIELYRSYKKEYTVEAKGEKLLEWSNNELAVNAPNIMYEQVPAVQYYHFSDFSGGSLVMITPEPPTGEAMNIQKRAASVFDLAYRRFLDLKRAELQTYKARIEVALERVRARALAMHNSDELRQVIQVLRHEMGFLGVEELETCSIYVRVEDDDRAECWFALKDDEKENDLIADYCELNLKDTWVGREMLRFYNSSNEQISVEMSIANQKEWIRYCEERSAPLRKYFAAHKQESMFHLYKFSGGAIGVASSVNLSEETWSLLKRAASVFSLAYSRFKDLKKAASDLLQLKLEKQRAEEALSELKATQSQLIHAEKMASLGELTAGIAHEIQNPLNFVNNFSDLSRELLDEMMTELKTANSDEAIEIAKDVKRNVEKILHHGKRADAIVKGMLQHSRGSSGIKEPTDINELADEFLRVAFHGLRAKDASFNATFSTDLDSTIGNVNIMPQDFGRVLLNLITNAFYAVSEKKNLVGDALQPDGKPYQPSVAIITRKNGKKVEISVKDNGNGIPREIREKIFQPFFTTKPTGQGTGLGLSLSYDFIKAHGGKLEVKTHDGEGAEFVIEIPADD